MKRKAIFLSLLLAIGLFSGCSSDDDNVMNDNCYTGIVKYIGVETGSVQAIITETPNGSDLSIGCEVIFKGNELSDLMPQVDDVINFIIIDYARIEEPNGPNFMHCFVCKVKPCK